MKTAQNEQKSYQHMVCPPLKSKDKKHHIMEHCTRKPICELHQCKICISSILKLRK